MLVVPQVHMVTVTWPF